MKRAVLAFVVASLCATSLVGAGQLFGRDRTMVAVFTATIPCIDCSSHKLELTLHAGIAAGPLEGTYELRETFTFVTLPSGERGPDREKDSRGRWIEVKGTDTEPAAIVYRLDPDKPADTWNFLRVSDDELREIDGARRESRLQVVVSFRRVMVETPGQLAGYRPISVEAPDVKGAAEFAARAQALRSGDGVSLTRIVSAYQHLVRSLSFRLCLEVTIQGKPARTTVIVYRDLNGHLALSQWLVGDCQ